VPVLNADLAAAEITDNLFSALLGFVLGVMHTAGSLSARLLHRPTLGMPGYVAIVFSHIITSFLF